VYLQAVGSVTWVTIAVFFLWFLLNILLSFCMSLCKWVLFILSFNEKLEQVKLFYSTKES
jgi:hypothetical protein